MKTFEYTNHDILYHCRTTIVCASTLGAELGVTIKRLDFSDSQGGKGACDHKEASIKSHMHIYLNSGHDIETPEQMTDAIRSSGGVPSLSVTLCDYITSPSMDSQDRWSKPTLEYRVF